MANVPVISISIDESTTPDVETKGLCIDDAKTDVEDLDSDTETKMMNGLLATTNKKPRGSLTDVEHFSSDGELENYDTKDYDAKITLDEFLDQGEVNESAEYFGTKKKMPKTTMNQSSNLLVIENVAVGGTTDCEDMQDSGPEEVEPEVKYEYDDKPIVLEDGGSVNIHDASKKRTSTYIPKTKEISSDSSDEEPVNTKVRHPPRHHLHHKQHHSRSIQDAKSDVENMVFSDDERKPRKQSAPLLNIHDADEMTFEASDCEDMDPELMKMSKSMTFPEINITFASEPSNKKKKPCSAKPSSTLGIPASNEDALTDVENLDSGDSDNEGPIASAYPKCQLWKRMIPQAVIKDHRDTDEEDMGNCSDTEGLLDPRFSDDIDMPLPSPHRELKIVKDNEHGQPQVEVHPIGDNFCLGIDNFDDGGVTDCEDHEDEHDDVANYDESKYALDKLPDIDGGSVESADKSIDKNKPESRRVSSVGNTLGVEVNDNPLTDTEELAMGNEGSSSYMQGTCELRRRRGKAKTSSSKNSGFLIVSENQDNALTDVEEMDLEDDETKGKFGTKRRPTLEIATILNSNDTMTDEENFSGGEDCMGVRKSPVSRPLSALNQENYCTSVSSMDCLDVNKPGLKNNRRLCPIIRKISPSPDTMTHPGTDTEDIPCYSDVDEDYSRAQTATPHEVHKALQDTLEHSEVHEAHTGAFDSRKERKHLKDPREHDAHTDVSDVELPVGNGKI